MKAEIEIKDLKRIYDSMDVCANKYLLKDVIERLLSKSEPKEESNEIAIGILKSKIQSIQSGKDIEYSGVHWLDITRSINGSISQLSSK